MDFATTRQAPSDQLALDLNLSGDVMTDTMAGVEPWMQEMLNEHFFSPTAQELTSEMAPSTVAVNDMAWMNPQALPAPVGNFDFSLTPNDQLLAADVSQNSFNSSTDLDFDLSEFLTEPATAGQQMVSNEVFGEQNFGALPEFPSLEATQEDHSQSAFDHVASAIRELARARATADPRPLSRKQKQSDASIALYLERLRDACDDAVAVITSSNTSNRSESSSNFHSPDLGSLQSSFHSEYVPQTQGHGIASASNSALLDSFTFPINSHQSSPQDSLISFTTSASTPNSESPTQQQQPAHRPVTGGIEMVMDLNMNAATTLPRRHRPRTQAQREQYLAVRNRGACEKHKRQHKRVRLSYLSFFNALFFSLEGILLTVFHSALASIRNWYPSRRLNKMRF